MAVVTSTFSTTANQVWASPTWSTDDPSFKLNTQLTNWVNAINDPTKISLIHTPGNATSRASDQTVRWLFRAREADTGSDYGFGYARIASDYSQFNNGNVFAYFQRSVSSDNNGAGSFSVINSSRGRIRLDQANVSHFTAYEAAGQVPWFAYSASMLPATGAYIGESATVVIARLSTAAAQGGSYYPSSGLGKWAVFGVDADGGIFVTPQARITSPFIGVNSGASAYPIPFRPKHDGGDGNGFFWAAPGLYGDTHYIGQPSPDILITTEQTGSWGDTTLISGATYRCLRATSFYRSQICFWVKAS